MLDKPFSRRIALVTPVYNDWVSLEQLLDAIDTVPGLDDVRFHVIVVDDASDKAPQGLALHPREWRRIEQIEVVNLVCNLGHQRAIAVGLVAATRAEGIDGAIVMDSDGEDRPEDLPRLLAAAQENPWRIICARRAKRSESMRFKACYAMYKLMFRVMTGAKIGFGNFCFIPRQALDRLVHNPMLWNYLAASIARSRIPLLTIDTIRGKRYAGQSSMNFISLVLHGLSAISVYADVALVRVLVGMCQLAGITIAGMGTVAMVRLFSNLAIPGWASSVMGSLGIVLLQSLILAAISAFMLLSARGAKPIIPAIDATQYIQSYTPRKERRRARPADSIPESIAI